MSFLERFSGRTSFMNKEGVTGIVAQKAMPIDKTPGTSQINYYTPKNDYAGASGDRPPKLSNRTNSELQRDDLQKLSLKTPQYQPSYPTNNDGIYDSAFEVHRSLTSPEQMIGLKSPQQSVKSTRNNENGGYQNGRGFSNVRSPALKKNGLENQTPYPTTKNKKPEVIPKAPKQNFDVSQHQSLQLPPKFTQQPAISNSSSKKYIVQQNILSNANHVDFGMRYQVNNMHADRYKQYQYSNGSQTDLTNRSPQQEQLIHLMDMQQQRFQEYAPSRGLYLNEDSFNYQQPTQFYQDQTYNTLDSARNSVQQPFRPYTLKDYKALQSQSSNVRRGGLGPNTYTEDWVKKKEKTDRMMVFAEMVRISNNKNVPISEVRKPHTEENRFKPQRFPSKQMGRNPTEAYQTYDVDREGYMLGKQLGKQERQHLQYLNTIDHL